MSLFYFNKQKNDTELMNLYNNIHNKIVKKLHYNNEFLNYDTQIQTITKILTEQYYVSNSTIEEFILSIEKKGFLEYDIKRINKSLKKIGIAKKNTKTSNTKKNPNYFSKSFNIAYQVNYF